MLPILTGTMMAGFLPDGLLSSTWNIILVILGVGFLIFVHELGHFAVAKWCGVEVEAFSIGFGPFLGWKKGETEYRLSLIPLGGYVKMTGEGLPVKGETYPERDLRSKSGLARAAIFSAGVIMNAIAAVFIFVVAFTVGVDLPPPVVGGVIPGSAAWEAGLEPGDRVLDIDGHKPIDLEDLVTEFAYSEEKTDRRVKIQRGDETREITLQATRLPGALVPTVGIDFRGVRPITDVLHVVPDGPAARAGLQTGDRLAAVAGQTVESPYILGEILASLGTRPGPIAITVMRDGSPVNVELEADNTEGKKLIGVTPYDGEILKVRPGSAAEAAGFEVGDVFLQVEGEETPHYDAFRKKLLSIAPSENEIGVEVARKDGSDPSVLISIRFRDARERSRLIADIVARGTGTRFRAVDAAFLAESPVRRAGIPDGSTIVAVDDEKVSTWAEVVAAIQKAGGEAVRLTWKDTDGNQHTSGPIEPAPSRTPDLGLALMGAKEKIREDVGTAVVLGFKRAVVNGARVFGTILGIFRGSISGKALGGPVMIFKSANIYASQSFTELLLFLGMLSVNLAIINLLPIPILDGGHLVFLLIEKVKGSPVREGTFAIAQWAGLAMILALLVYVTFNDILRML